METKLEYTKKRIEQLRTFLSSSNPIASITVDGMTVTYNRHQAMEELEKMEKQLDALKNPRRWIKSIDLS
jgi:hypothetical protein